MSMRGLMAARGARSIRDLRNFTPDVVFGSLGWGETLFLREVFPDARHLTYAEFFYRPQGLDADFDPEFQPQSFERRISVRARQAHLLQAIADADEGLAPTRWQADSFPDWARGKIRVIHDGIDTARLAPEQAAQFHLPDGRVLRAGDEVLTFVNRNIEPYRGAHVFLRALPAVLASRPDAQVVIVGGDGVSYGAAPPGGGSWKDRLWAEVADRCDAARVHFVGRVPYADFVSLMQVTRVHAYLTYPFVLSWSLLEAMSAGAMIVASDTPPVAEVITDGVEGRLVGFFDVPGWSAALIAALADPAAGHAMRHAARARVIRDYDLHTVCLPRLIDWIEGRG